MRIPSCLLVEADRGTLALQLNSTGPGVFWQDGIDSEEKAMMLANKNIRGNDDGVIVEDLKEMANYYRERLREIQYKLLEIERKEKVLKLNIIQTNTQYSNH